MKLLCLFLSILAGASRAAVLPSADEAFTLQPRGARLETPRAPTTLAWTQAGGVRVSIERLPESIPSSGLLTRARKDSETLSAKGRRVDPPRLLSAGVPFSLCGFGMTSFGYFNAGGNSYSYLVKGLKRSQAAEIFKTLKEVPKPDPAAAAPAEIQEPPASVLPESLPPADGDIALVEGRYSFPKTQGWRFVQQDDGWSLLEGPDWSFALSQRVIAQLPGSAEGTVQEVAAGYFARFELDFVGSRGCATSPIDAAELENGWKILFKKYACPEMGASRRQLVGVLLPHGEPLIGWTGDYDRPEHLAAFHRWLGQGRAMPASSLGRTTPAHLAAAIGGALGFAVMILFMIWRRRKARAAGENP